MSKAPPPDQPTKTIRERSAERSAAALRDNLKRRKAQQRARDEPDGDLTGREPRAGADPADRRKP